MSKVEEFYNALIKDPELEIKAGQSRHDAARQEAEYRARQYNNNAQALAMAVSPEESPINSLLNHVQNLHKASKTFLIKAPSDAEKQAKKDAEEAKKISDKQPAKITFDDNLGTRDFLIDQGYTNDEITEFNNQGLLHNKKGDKSLSTEDALKNVNKFLDKKPKNKKPKEFTDEENKKFAALKEQKNKLVTDANTAVDAYNKHKNEVFGPLDAKIKRFEDLNIRKYPKTRAAEEKRLNLPAGSINPTSVEEEAERTELHKEKLGQGPTKKRLYDVRGEAYKKAMDLKKVVDNATIAIKALDTDEY